MPMEFLPTLLLVLAFGMHYLLIGRRARVRLRMLQPHVVLLFLCDCSLVPLTLCAAEALNPRTTDWESDQRAARLLMLDFPLIFLAVVALRLWYLQHHGEILWNVKEQAFSDPICTELHIAVSPRFRWPSCAPPALPRL